MSDHIGNQNNSEQMSDRSEKFIASVQKLRAEVEKVRQTNDELYRQLEPYETWYANSVKKLTEFANDHDLYMIPKRWKKKDIAGRLGTEKVPKIKSHPAVSPESDARRPRGRPRKFPIQQESKPQPITIKIPKFPYQYFKMDRILTNDQCIVPGTNITLRSDCLSLFRARPDLWAMAMRPQNPGQFAH